MTTRPSTETGAAAPNARRQARREERRRRRHLIKDISRVFIVAVFFVAAGVFFSTDFAREHLLDLRELRIWLHPEGSIGERLISYGLFTFISALLISIGLFRSIVCIAAGSIYGAVIGIVLATISSMVGAWLTWLIGSSLLKGTVKRRLQGRRIDRLRQLLVAHPFSGTLYLRLFPGTSALMTGLICGSSRIPLRTYHAANFIGFLPQTLVFCIFGSGATKMRWEQLVLGLGIFIVVSIIQFYAARKLRSRRATPETAAEVNNR